VPVPDWNNFGIAMQLQYGQTFGRMLGHDDDPMPSERVLRAAWEVYRDRFAGARSRPWAALVFDDGIDPDEARTLVRGT
jgi:hypothetical protein